MKIIPFILLFICFSAMAQKQNAYQFLKRKSEENKPVEVFNKYEDIVSGSMAFVIGNIGYFTSSSAPLQVAYSGVQTVGIIAVGHGIYDFYYPHFETRLLEITSRKEMKRGDLADAYVSLLGEMERAKRISLLWSSSLLTMQYALNAFVSPDISQDMKDIYLFLGGVNAIVATYSYFKKSDYEEYFLEHQRQAHFGLFIMPDREGARTGLGVSKAW